MAAESGCAYILVRNHLMYKKDTYYEQKGRSPDAVLVQLNSFRREAGSQRPAGYPGLQAQCPNRDRNWRLPRRLA